jgi:hypothetical protein
MGQQWSLVAASQWNVACATDAIDLHDFDLKRTPENILFPGNKKYRFMNFLRARAVPRVWYLKVEAWSFYGCWMLDVGCFQRP